MCKFHKVQILPRLYIVLAEGVNATSASVGRSLSKEKREASIISVSYNITVSVSFLAPPSLISSHDRGNEAPRAVATERVGTRRDDARGMRGERRNERSGSLE